MSKTYDYVKYDDNANEMQALFKAKFIELEKALDNLSGAGRATALAKTKLEEAYMWIGKAIRDNQIARNAGAQLMEERKNG